VVSACVCAKKKLHRAIECDGRNEISAIGAI